MINKLSKLFEPTEAQKEAGNYFKPRIFANGLEVAIENPVGTQRTGKNSNGTRWETTMANHYGYIVGSKGVDGDPVDVYIGNYSRSDKVFVVHQSVFNDWDVFDEDKCMLFFDDAKSAKQAYLAHYDDERFFLGMTEMSMGKFKKKIVKNEGQMIKANFFDLSVLSCGCENDTRELLGKAMSEDQHDIWEPHENSWISQLIEQFTSRGLSRTDDVKGNMMRWIVGAYHRDAERFDLNAMAPVWSNTELNTVKQYLETLLPNKWALKDYDYLVQYLFQRYLPADELMTEAETLVTRAHILGKISLSQGANPAGNIANIALSVIPVTVASAFEQFTFAVAEKQIMEYARLKAMDLVVAMSDQSKHALKSVLLDHMQKKFSGDESATPGKLQQELFDKFSTMNRDWRRIALTESGEAFNQGVIASLEPGTRVRRMEQYRGACGFCKKIHGVEMTVVSPDDPNKDEKTDVWAGKNNVGRSSSPYKKTDDGLVKRLDSELWTIPAGTVHPHCRGRWEVLSALKEGDSQEFADWFKEATKNKSQAA